MEVIAYKKIFQLWHQSSDICPCTALIK